MESIDIVHRHYIELKSLNIKRKKLEIFEGNCLRGMALEVRNVYWESVYLDHELLGIYYSDIIFNKNKAVASYH